MSRLMKQFIRSAAQWGGLVLSLVPGAVSAAEWAEVGDAGELPNTAQVTSGPSGQPLTSITGTISATTDIDLYRIYISQPAEFSAVVSGGDAAPFDSVLALFDGEGLGVYFNDDRVVDDGNSELPAGNVNGPMTPGFYYLAIFSDYAYALSGSGTSENDLIFPLVNEPWTDVVGATGPGGSAPLSTWFVESTFALGNAYQIGLSGADFAESTAAEAGPLFASVLPSSRSVQVGDPATAFATLINSGAGDATSCSIAPVPALAATFDYQTTDPATNALTGTVNTPVDIAAGASQSFVFAFTPTGPIAAQDVELTFACDNADPAATVVGLNTLLLVADPDPVPDIVALGATLGGNGIVDVVSGSGVFAVATSNVGVEGSIAVTADDGGVDLPISIAICETDPGTGACVNPATPTAGPVVTTIGAGATPTFGFFISATGAVPFDPANNRIFVRFVATGGSDVVRGATSVAVRTP